MIAPFFVTYLILMLAWQTILSDEGLVLDVLTGIGYTWRTGAGCSPPRPPCRWRGSQRLPALHGAPALSSLEQIDARLIEVADYLYASKVQAFLRVTLPLSLPVFFAGTLLTFIPAAGDFINAELLKSAAVDHRHGSSRSSS